MNAASNAVPHVVIHGYYGAGNFGDDIILLSIIGSLLDREPDMDITVLSRNISPIPDNHRFHTVSRFDMASVAQAIQKADLFICGGGGIFQDYSGFGLADHFGSRTKSLDYYAPPIEAAYLLQKPIMLYAVGAGPLFSPIYRRYLKTILDWADVITTRDRASAALLKSINPGVNPIVTADPAVGYTQQPGHTVFGAGGKYAAICLRSWFFKDGERAGLIRCFSETADHLVERHGYHVVLLPFSNSKADRNLHEAVYQHMRNSGRAALADNLPARDAADVLRQAGLVVGMRLHSLIVATSNFIPALGIAYDDKVRHYMDSIGMQDYTLSLTDVRSSYLKEKTDALLGNRAQVAAQLGAAIPALIEREKENAALAAGLMRRGRHG